jgi:SSS family solute:Na+ symporter
VTYPLASLAVVLIYLAVIAWIGLRGRAFASSGDIYNIVGRQAGVVRAASGYLSLIGGGELILLTQLGYDNGFGVMWFLGGLAAGFAILALFSNKVRENAKRGNINTLVGYFTSLYGRAAGAALTVVFVVSLGSLLTIQFIVGSDLLAIVTGLPRDVTPILMGLVIVIYLVPGGLVAVLSTDVLRTFMMIIVLAILGISLWQFAPIAPGAGTSTFTPLGILDGGTLFILGAFGVICAADVWQTVLASSSQAVIRRSMITAAVALVLIGLLIAQLGITTKMIVPNLGADTPALIAAIQNTIPGLLAPVIALLIIGAVMSTADTEVWVISTSLLSNWFPAPNSVDDNARFQSRVKRATQLALPIVTLIAVGLAYISRDAQALYQGLLVLLTAIAPTMLAVMIFNPRQHGVAAGLWAGLIAFALTSILYRFEIPGGLALLPAAVGLVGFLMGHLISSKPGFSAPR